MKTDRRPFRVVSVGDMVVDVILSIPGLPVKAAEHQILNDMQLEPGGAGNFLIAGARLGMEMTALAAVGFDHFSDALIEMLEGEGIRVDGLVRQQGGSTTIVFVLEDPLRNHVFLGQFGQGDDVPLSEDWKMRIESADAVQLWGYSLNETRMIDCVMAAAEFANGLGKTIVFDPGPLLGSAKPEDCQKLISSATIVLCTEEELDMLGSHCKTAVTPSEILKLGPSVVCVKYGQDGCKIFTEAGTFEHPGFVVPVVDTNAAGDSFMAAFVFGYLSEWPLQTLAAFANAMGAAKVQKFGSGRQVPTIYELRKMLCDFGIDIEI